ncbi:hypothetical protein EVG20_g893 [Dentipellis fragilis]|uniref:Uncharacterized protein n=1 Tax=Dentipellis fragilis TaxID=205917 RepID=A0A4Y9ZB75_9AGAM|nr:hypothetical protein EVG20_g893 [Dentipellis fragilis]
MSAPRSLRFAFRSLALKRPSRPTCNALLPTPHYSRGPRFYATEPSSDFINNIKHTELFHKIADKPNALKALSDLAELVKEMGIDITSSTPPSNIQMFRLATNRRFTRAVKNVMSELQNAGLDMRTESAMQELMNLTKEVKPNDDKDEKS